MPDLNEHINLYGFVSDEVFLTKSGDLGTVIQVEGIDYECLDPGTLENVARRFEVAQKMFDGQFRFYQYLCKRNKDKIPFESYDNEVVNQAIANRAASLGCFAPRTGDRLWPARCAKRWGITK